VKADKAMVAELLAIHLRAMTADVSRAGDRAARVDAAFAEAFRRYGIDVEHLAMEVAASRIAAREIAAELVEGLDIWTRFRHLRKRDDPGWKHLLAVARQADPDSVRNQVRLAWAQGQRDTLVKLARDSNITAGRAATVVLLGESLRYWGELDQAVNLFQRAQPRYPGDFWINLGLASFLTKLRPPQHQKAVAYFLTALALHDSPVVRDALGESLRQSGSLDQAIAVFREALRLKADDVDARLHFGMALSDKGQWDEAMDEFRNILKIRADHVEALNNLGHALQQRNRLDDAIAMYRKALQVNPGAHQAHNNLGVALARKGLHAEALAEFQKAVELKTDMPEVYYHLGLLQAHKEQTGEAIKMFGQAIAMKENFPSAHYELGNALQGKQRWQEAVAAYRKALLYKNDHVQACNALAWLLANCPNPRLREPQLAVRVAERAVAMQPQSGAYWTTLGTALYRAGNWKGSVKVLQRSVALRKGGDSYDFFFLAMAHGQLRQQETARAWYDKAVAWMNQHAADNHELRRFADEAATLLKITTR
jgi:tetratricopeptide (TPR) repeat protein